MWLADHGTSGPEVVLAVGVAPSRRWAEQWYGLVVAVAPCSVAGCGPGCVSPSSPLSAVLDLLGLVRTSANPLSGTWVPRQRYPTERLAE